MPRDLLALRNAAQDANASGYGDRADYSNVRTSSEFQRGQPVRGNSRGNSREGRDGPAAAYAPDAQGPYANYRAPAMQGRPSQEGARGYPANAPIARQASTGIAYKQPSGGSASQPSLAQLRGLPPGRSNPSLAPSPGPRGGVSPPSPRDFVPSFAYDNTFQDQRQAGPQQRQDSVDSYYYTGLGQDNGGRSRQGYTNAPRAGSIAPSAYAPEESPRGGAPDMSLYDQPYGAAVPRGVSPGRPAAGGNGRQQIGIPAQQGRQDRLNVPQQPPMQRQDSDGQYSEKSPSFVDGTPPQSGGGKLRKKGPAIKKGEVPNEEMGEFFGEISDLQSGLREIDSQISHISSLHLRLLDVANSDDASAQALKSSLSQSTKSTRAFMNEVKARIKSLEQGNANLRAMIPLGQSAHNLTLADVDVRNTQVSALKERFKEAIQRYGEVERDARAKNRARMERQVRIVNPQMSKDEVTQLVRDAEDGGETAVFSQALMQQGARSFAARGALREVESRAAALARIEQTLVELAQLFNDMSTLVEAQDVQIIDIEQKATAADNDMEKGLDQTKKAVVSARSARKWRWVCFGIFLVIILIVVLVLLFQVILPAVRKNNNSNAQQNAPRPVTTSAVILTADVPTLTSGALAPSTAALVMTTVAPSSPTAAPTSSASSYDDGSGDSGSTDDGSDSTDDGSGSTDDGSGSYTDSSGDDGSDSGPSSSSSRSRASPTSAAADTSARGRTKTSSAPSETEYYRRRR